MKDYPSIENLKSELISLLKSQNPNRTELIHSIENIENSIKKTRAYLYFVDNKNPNQPNSEWQFSENIILESTLYGTLIVDVLTKNRIGGVEFYNRLK